MSLVTAPSNELTIWSKWVLFSIAGMLLSYLPARLLTMSIDPTLYVVLYTLVWLLMGAILSTMQWLVLRQWVKDFKQWIIITSVGFVAAAYISTPIILLDMYYNLKLPYDLGRPFQLDEVIFGTVFGAIMGLAQWFVLKRYFHQAMWWIVGSTVGWTLGRLIGELIPFNWNLAGTGMIYEVIVSLIPMMVMGIVLVRLSRLLKENMI